jgi:cytochrome c-type biogenesis protein CcmE
MDPNRKRAVRFAVALTCAVALAGALVYTSFTASTEAKTPTQLLSGALPGKTYELTGKVSDWKKTGSVHEFRVRDRVGQQSVPVRYDGQVPDPFREGREIIIDVRKEGGVFVGQRDSLVTKCPSKFTEEKRPT